VLHDGNNPEFDAVIARPDLFCEKSGLLRYRPTRGDRHS
jgi:hypothetical protein